MVHTANGRNTITTVVLQKDIDQLFAKRRSLARSGSQTVTISSIYVIRELEANAKPILFLLHAPKRNIKEAHQRNKLKRWMREAIRQSDEIGELQNILSERRSQVLLLLRADFSPSKDHSWQQIKDDISIITKRLIKNIHSS